MTQLRVRFQVLDQVYDRIFENMAHIPDDYREPFELMAEEFWRQNEATFQAEGLPEPWMPLSPKYRKWKEKHYPGKPILVRSGALKASLVNGTAEGAIYEVFPTQMILGTEVPHAIYHQTGSMKVQNRPPKRPPVMLTTEMRTKWSEIMANWLRDNFAYIGE